MPDATSVTQPAESMHRRVIMMLMVE